MIEMVEITGPRDASLDGTCNGCDRQWDQEKMQTIDGSTVYSLRVGRGNHGTIIRFCPRCFQELGEEWMRRDPLFDREEARRRAHDMYIRNRLRAWWASDSFKEGMKWMEQALDKDKQDG
jgi:hypothetical protein